MQNQAEAVSALDWLGLASLADHAVDMRTKYAAAVPGRSKYFRPENFPVNVTGQSRDNDALYL